MDGREANELAYLVAPYVGAWIETKKEDTFERPNLSHPTWVRGLKHIYMIGTLIGAGSHPTWVRGLKQPSYQEVQVEYVAPYVGAWIET